MLRALARGSHEGMLMHPEDNQDRKLPLTISIVSYIVVLLVFISVVREIAYSLSFNATVLLVPTGLHAQCSSLDVVDIECRSCQGSNTMLRYIEGYMESKEWKHTLDASVPKRLESSAWLHSVPTLTKLYSQPPQGYVHSIFVDNRANQEIFPYSPLSPSSIQTLIDLHLEVGGRLILLGSEPLDVTSTPLMLRLSNSLFDDSDMYLPKDMFITALNSSIYQMKSFDFSVVYPRKWVEDRLSLVRSTDLTTKLSEAIDQVQVGLNFYPSVGICSGTDYIIILEKVNQI